MLEKNLIGVFKNIENGNNLGEKVIVVGATKTIDTSIINNAINLGLEYVAENKVSEFRAKTDSLEPCHVHFIGHLQTNKVKYLIGKVELIHSLDRLELAQEINIKSENKNVVTNCLVQVNIGNELTKGGFLIENLEQTMVKLLEFKNINLQGLMAMFPLGATTGELVNYCKQMRDIYDKIKSTNKNFKYLSMGMSGDYKIAVQNGSNMVRLGSSIFGNRIYS